MRAFVLSGGGNRGPLQVGALKALLEHDIVPEMIAGSSVGSLNGVYLAIDPTLAQVEKMAALWHNAGRQKLFTQSPPRSLAKLVRGRDHLVENRRIREYVAASLPADARTFGDLKVPMYATICHLQTQTLYVYGDDPTAPLVDAVITSSAVPGFFPPTYHAGQAFVDGGVVSNLPMKVAVAKGATEIWALDLSFEVEANVKLRNVLEIAGYAIKRPLYENALREIEWAIAQGVTVHHIPLNAYVNTPLGDFSQIDAMMAEGERAARKYLAHPRPNHPQPPKHHTAYSLPAGPHGAVPFIEPRLHASRNGRRHTEEKSMKELS
jgi:NTE family protein